MSLSILSSNPPKRVLSPSFYWTWTHTGLHSMVSSDLCLTWPVYSLWHHCSLSSSYTSCIQFLGCQSLGFPPEWLFFLPHLSWFLSSTTSYFRVPQGSVLSFYGFIYSHDFKYFLFASVSQIFISSQTSLINFVKLPSQHRSLDV